MSGDLALRREGSGPCLVLLHGGVGSATHWARTIPFLARHFTVVAPDLPGFGASADVAPGTTGPAYIDLVQHKLDQVLGTTARHMVGFSFGAVITAALAARWGGLVQAVTLLGPGGFGRPTGRVLDVVKLPEDQAARRHAAAHNLGVTMLAATPADDDPVVDLTLANIAAARFDSRSVSLGDTLRSDLRRITAPVQLIWGDTDRFAHPSPAARAQACRDARPEVVTEIIPQAGHWVQWDAPGAVNERVLRFHTSQASPA